jgi:hypothetical protein
MINSTDAGIKNINKLTELLNIHYSIFSSDTSQHNSWQSLNGCHKVKWIKMYNQNGNDIISDLRNFPNLLYFEAQTYKPNINLAFGSGGFPNMYVFVVGYSSNNVISSSEINLILNTQAAAGTVTNGYMGFTPPGPVITSGGATAYSTLISRGWTLELMSP